MSKIKILLLSLLIIYGCEKRKFGDPNVDTNEVQSEYWKWYQYQYRYLDLNSDFSPLDENSNNISKKKFLEKIRTGKYFAVKMNSTKSTIFYKLIPFNLQKSDKKIKKAVIQQAEKELKNENLVGNPFPHFKYKDIDGNTIASDDFKKKAIMVAFWSIECRECISEIPVINFFARKYADENVAFLSFAYDKNEELLYLLSQRQYDYDPISISKKDFLNKFNVKLLPTHMYVTEKGTIKAVSNDVRHFRKRLENIYEY